VPRVVPLDPADSEGSNREIFQRFLNERGNIPNMIRTAGHDPELLRTMVAHIGAVMRGGTVPPLLKELLAVRVSQINRCGYCLASHVALARRLGAKAEQIETMNDLAGEGADGPSGLPADCLGTAPIEPPASAAEPPEELFTPAERAALEFAGQMTRGTGHVPDEAFLAISQHYPPAEIVEIVAVVGLFNYLSRFNNALEVEIPR